VTIDEACHDSAVGELAYCFVDRFRLVVGDGFVASQVRLDVQPFWVVSAASVAFSEVRGVGVLHRDLRFHGLIIARSIPTVTYGPSAMYLKRRTLDGGTGPESEDSILKYRIERNPDGEWIVADVWKRGSGLLSDPLLNKGTAFSKEERELFELDAMLPYQPTDRQHQVVRAYEHLQDRGDNPLEKYVAMTGLMDRNETLFYQVLANNVEELLPIVYTPTVGTAAMGYSHLFRRGRGLWITPDHKGRIFEILGHARSEDVKLIVVTDNERILGLGDQGVGGMVIPIGKLALYTLGAGIHPAYTLPISLDVGTDNERLLNDDLYAGWRQPRLRGEEYYELVDEFVDAIERRWPEAVLQWEDFKKVNAFKLLDRYRDQLPSFNDDIQGTAGVVVAGILAACRATGTKLADQRVLLVGAGAAGVGIARHLRHDLEQSGVSGDDLFRAVSLLDTTGLVATDRAELDLHKQTTAWPAELAAQTGLSGESQLMEVIEAVHPTVLIGTTGEPGVFSEEVVRAVASYVERPVVMALSNPTSKTEAVPADVFEWTEGRALMATGSPFASVEYGGRTLRVSQGNNVYVFPGVGLAAIITGAKRVTDSMFAAAANALADLVSEEDLEAGVLYPPLADLRSISRAIARAVAKAACESGVGRDMNDQEIDDALDHEIWDLDYPTLRPV
jgi:malate dehydrogenase (oxaloacetate-decarboxylating)